VLTRLLAKLSYANVMATAAVFIALGGSSYAVLRVDSTAIVDHSIKGRDVAGNTLDGRQVAETKLRRVPRARIADGLGAKAKQGLQLRCQSDSALAAGLCFEKALRRPSTYLEAATACGAVNTGNRRLPTAAELVAYFDAGGQIAPGGELTSNVFESRTVPGRLDVLILQDEAGNASVAPAVPLDGQGGGTVRVPFRCVTTPTNVP
jgi:hypothetical protein